MGRPIKIAKSMTQEGVGKDIGYPAISSFTAVATPAGLTSLDFYGVIAGQISESGSAAPGPGSANPVVSVRVKIAGATEADGFIVRQKGSRKYLVQDVNGNTGVCVLADKVDSTLADGEMTITVYGDDSSGIRLRKLTNKFATAWDDTVYFVSMFTGPEGETVSRAGSTDSISIVRIETAVSV